MKINENIAYAKSVMVKNGITPDSPEYKDFLKIREICGNDHGYVGILTKIRFVDNITDMDEIKSIYDVLKKSKFDFAKLNKLTYNEILEIFYDELSGESNKDSDLELVFKDNTYSYYRVHTYKGILKIGSPSWCLKTKSMWDKYQAIYPEQWVVVDNRYKNRLITPDNNYMTDYKSDKGYIRYGISLKQNTDETISWQAFSDNNIDIKLKPEGYTFFGVMCTVLNLVKGIKKSYYDHFPWCEKYKDSKTWHKVIDNKGICDRFRLGEDFFRESEVYVNFSETYSGCPTFLVLNNATPFIFFPTSAKSRFAECTNKYTISILEEYGNKSDDILYSGVKLKTGNISMDEIEKNDRYITKVGKWLIFHRNSKYYLIVNSEVKNYQLLTETLKNQYYDMNDPMYFYLEKETAKTYKGVNFEGIQDIINGVFEFEENKNSDKDEVDEFDDESSDKSKKVKGFWDFLKKKD